MSTFPCVLKCKTQEQWHSLWHNQQITCNAHLSLCLCPQTGFAFNHSMERTLRVWLDFTGLLVPCHLWALKGLMINPLFYFSWLGRLEAGGGLLNPGWTHCAMIATSLGKGTSSKCIIKRPSADFHTIRHQPASTFVWTLHWVMPVCSHPFWRMPFFSSFFFIPFPNGLVLKKKNKVKIHQF